MSTATGSFQDGKGAASLPHTRGSPLLFNRQEASQCVLTKPEVRFLDDQLSSAVHQLVCSPTYFKIYRSPGVSVWLY